MSTLIAIAGQWRPDKRRALAPHLNAGLEMVLVAGGHTRWQIGGRVEEVTPGSVFYTLPWEQHGGVEEVEPGLELYFVVLRLDRQYRRAARRLGFDPQMPMADDVRRWIVHTLLSSGRRAVPASSALDQLIRQLVREAKAQQAGRDTALAGLASAAVVELARCVSAAAAARSAAVPSSAVARLHRFLLDLQRRCDEPWSLDQMARACGLRRTRFAELLKQQTGDTPTMALNRLRVRRAQQALRHSEQSITAIALACGFSSSQYFARVFRDYSGMSARQWRAKGKPSRA